MAEFWTKEQYIERMSAIVDFEDPLFGDVLLVVRCECGEEGCHGWTLKINESKFLGDQ